jgi:hypothetical protein
MLRKRREQSRLFSLLLASRALKLKQPRRFLYFESIALSSNSVQMKRVKPIDGESKWFSPRRTPVAVKIG